MNDYHCALGLVYLAGCTQQGAIASASVTEAVSHLETTNARVVGEIGPAAVIYLDGFAADLGLSSEEDWGVLSVGTGSDTLRHVRLQQVHRGVPVLGSEVVVHADETTFLAFGGTVTRNLEGFEVEPQVSEEGAFARFTEDHAASAGAAGVEYAVAAARLAIRPRRGQGADLVWRLEVLSEARAGVERGRWFALVDASSGEVIEAWNGLNTLEQASGPGGNLSGGRIWRDRLDVEPMDGQYAMKTARLETYDMKGNGGPFDDWFGGNGELVKGPREWIGDAAINDAHGFAEITLDMMRDWYGHDSIDDNGMVIVSRVHYGTNVRDASWDGKRVTYGDGDGVFAYAPSGALDIVAHEINHGFTEKHSNLGYTRMPGALSESFSDIAGSIAEFYLPSDPAGYPDLEIGEDIRPHSIPIRDMCNPTWDGASIDHVSQYDEGGTSVHHASGLGNKAFCLSVARHRVDRGIELASAVRAVGGAWYLANAAYWTSGTSFTQGCQGVIDAARALGFASDDVVAIQQSWADVGIGCESGTVCDGDGTCQIGDGETCFSCPADCGTCGEGCSDFDQAKCKIGIGDCSRCTEADGCGDGTCAGDETDASCPEDCGCGALQENCGSTAPFGCWCDASCGQTGDCCADVDVCQ